MSPRKKTKRMEETHSATLKTSATKKIDNQSLMIQNWLDTVKKVEKKDMVLEMDMEISSDGTEDDNGRLNIKDFEVRH